MSFLSIKRIIANINADSPGILMPTGTILTFSSMTPPSGYLLCDGKSYSNSTYPNLFAVIGTAYGSTSPSTFSVPDLRGMFLRGLAFQIGRMFSAESAVRLYLAGKKKAQIVWIFELRRRWFQLCIVMG